LANYRRVFEDGYGIFITVVTYNRVPILIDNINILKKSFELSKQRYNYSIDAIVILPDHFHMIIKPQNAKDYPKIVSHIKRSFIYGLDRNLTQKLKSKLTSSQARRANSAIWQKRYYEHTIRDEQDYKIRFDYIHFNPVKHKIVNSVKNWQYSSFYKYVKLNWYNENWGNFDEHIDFE